eukprot:PhF_6_TR4831/c0_g1_i1/m.6712
MINRGEETDPSTIDTIDSFVNPQSALPTATGLEHENVQLRKEVTELSSENQRLRQQVYQLSMYLEKVRTMNNVDVPGLETVLGSINIPLQSDVALQVKSLEDNGVTSSANGAGTSKTFRLHWDLKDHHNGAISVAKFSPNGLLLASGSIDKSIRIWSLQDKLKWKNNDHRLAISDLAWTEDSACVLSCSFDGMCKSHDVDTRTVTNTFSVGMALSCSLVPSSSTFLVSNMRKMIFLYDLRAPTKSAGIIHTKHIVNTMCVEPNNPMFFTAGDAAGFLQFYDIRNISPARLGTSASTTDVVGSTAVSPAVVVGTEDASMMATTSSTPPSSQSALRHVLPNDDGSTGNNGPAVCHLHQSRDSGHFRNSRYLISTCHDGVVRVFDRGSFDGSSADHFTRYRIRHKLVGQTCRNFPIRASSWSGVVKSEAKDDIESDQPARRSLQESSLVASGSTDNAVYIHDMSEGQATLLQRLEGHKDIVYGTHFHPTEPMLVTYSADASIKFWIPAKK